MKYNPNVDYDQFALDMEKIFGSDYAQRKRNQKIENFLNIWKQMLDASEELRLEGLECDFSIKVSSSKRLEDA